MEPWERELDQYLAPHGVVFSEQACTQTFKQEMRTQLRSVRLPLVSHALLYDGMGSLIVRLTSLIILAWMYPPFWHKLDTPKIPFVINVFFVLMSLPGLWMWWYRLMMPCEKRRQRMQALFEKKVKEREQNPPFLRS